MAQWTTYTKADADGVRLPAGCYWVGDPWFALDDHTYNNVWSATYDCADGAYCKGTRRFAVAGTPSERCSLYTHTGAYVDVWGGAVGIFSIGLTRHDKSGRLERVGAYIGSKSPVSFKYEGGVFTLLYDWDRYLRIDTNAVHADSDDDESELGAPDKDSASEGRMDSDVSDDG